MKERLLEFLKSENKSSAQLAEEIGVQPSGISHILSGRNNPSLDFVLKMLEKYQFLSTDWLLFGKGTMYKDPKMQSLFEYENVNDRKNSAVEDKTGSESIPVDELRAEKEVLNRGTTPSLAVKRSEISRVIIFYSDSSFDEYSPK
ncbi:MAG: helix-turn-helix transcriptional regulator [Bacteroidales bacterium]|nr:helix-turn-helix transcriptional regulator [Bacteroidales bacterium]